MKTAGPFARGLAISFGLEFIAGVLRLAVPLLAARALGVEGFGTYSATTSLTLLLFSVGCGGLPLSATYHAASNPYRQVAWRVFAICAAAALSSALLLGPLALLYGDAALSNVSLPLLVLILAAVVPYALDAAALGVLRGVNRLGIAGCLTIAKQLGLGAVAIVAGARGLSVAEMLVGFVVVTSLSAASALATTLLVLRRAPVVSQYVSSNLRAICSYAGKVQASTLVTFLNYRLDLFIVASLLPARQTGIYVAAVSLAETLWFFSYVVASALAGRVAANDDARAARALTLSLCRLTTSASVLVAALMAILSPWLMRGFGTDFVAGWPVLVITLAGVAALAPSRILATYRAASGAPASNILGSLLGLVVNVLATLLLVPLLGLVGAAIGTLLAYSLVSLERIYGFRRSEAGGLRLRELLWATRQDVRQVLALARPNA